MNTEREPAPDGKRSTENLIKPYYAAGGHRPRNDAPKQHFSDKEKSTYYDMYDNTQREKQDRSGSTQVVKQIQPLMSSSTEDSGKENIDGISSKVNQQPLPKTLQQMKHTASNLQGARRKQPRKNSENSGKKLTNDTCISDSSF